MLTSSWAKSQWARHYGPTNSTGGALWWTFIQQVKWRHPSIAGSMVKFIFSLIKCFILNLTTLKCHFFSQAYVFNLTLMEKQRGEHTTTLPFTFHLFWKVATKLCHSQVVKKIIFCFSKLIYSIKLHLPKQYLFFGRAALYLC